MSVQQRTPPIRKHAHIPDTHLRGRWLLLVRVGVIVVVLGSLAMYVGSLPTYYAILYQPCSGYACTLAGTLDAAGIRALHAAGFSLGSYATYTLVLTVCSSLIWLVVGLVIFWRRSDDWVALLVACTLVITTFSEGPLQNGAIGALALAAPIWTLPVQIIVFLGFPMGVLSVGLFPTGRFAPRWVGGVVLLFLIVQLLSFLPPADSPLNSNNWPGIMWEVLGLGTFLTLIFSQIYRYRRVSTPVQRQQIKWAVFGFVLELVLWIGVFVFAIVLTLNQASALFEVISNTLWLLTSLTIPIFLGIAILRSRLWDIDLLINRTLVYGALTASVVGLYILVVGYLGTLFRTGGNLLISLVATGLVAVLFQPLRGSLQRGVNRLFYGQRDDPYAVLARLGSRLEAIGASEAVLPTIVETVGQALKLPYAAITLKHGDTFTPAASYGLPQDKLLILPLLYQTETIGQLLLAQRAPGEDFTAADRRLLADLARQTGIAAHAVRLTADLQRSRERVVTAREEERRRLRRDLHDGLGATLAALHLQAGAIRLLMRHDLDTACAEQLDLQAGLRSAIADIRRLVYALRPPTLDELGLVGAIRQYAAQYDLPGTPTGSEGGLRVTVHAPERLPELPAAVEVAAYRIVQEALTNVGRHAQARTCTIRLAIPDAFELEISDDGVGFSGESYVGVGLLSMRERAEEAGGSCLVESAPGVGTRILVQLPFSKE